MEIGKQQLSKVYQSRGDILQRQDTLKQYILQKYQQDPNSLTTQEARIIGLLPSTQGAEIKKYVQAHKDVELGVVHFNEMNNMDIICIGTHGKGGIFHHSATEKLINHLFKPIVSFHLQ